MTTFSDFADDCAQEFKAIPTTVDHMRGEMLDALDNSFEVYFATIEECSETHEFLGPVILLEECLSTPNWTGPSTWSWC